MSPEPQLSHPLESGVRLDGRYDIVERLSGGAQSYIYKARKVDLPHVVVLKFGLQGGEGALHRLRDEAAILASLNHPNICSLIDFDGSLGCLVLPFVEGDSLRQLLENETGNKLSMAESLQIMIQVCRALKAAHSRNVMHRDLHLGNIMHSRETGHTMVVDFGLAALKDNLEVTVSAYPHGAWEFMARERLAGNPYSIPADIYSCGVLLFKLLTGLSPVARLVAGEPSDPVDLLDALGRTRVTSEDRAVANLVARALSRDPAARPSAAEMLDELQHVGTQVKNPAPPRDLVFFDTGVLVHLLDDESPDHSKAAQVFRSLQGRRTTSPTILCETVETLARLSYEEVRPGGTAAVKFVARDIRDARRKEKPEVKSRPWSRLHQSERMRVIRAIAPLVLERFRTLILAGGMIEASVQSRLSTVPAEMLAALSPATEIELRDALVLAEAKAESAVRFCTTDKRFQTPEFREILHKLNLLWMRFGAD